MAIASALSRHLVQARNKNGDANMQKDRNLTDQDVLDIIKHYEELDTTNFPVTEPAIIKKLHHKKAMEQQFIISLSDETLELLSQHNTHQDHKRLDAVIKATYMPV